MKRIQVPFGNAFSPITSRGIRRRGIMAGKIEGSIGYRGPRAKPYKGPSLSIIEFDAYTFRDKRGRTIHVHRGMDRAALKGWNNRQARIKLGKAA